MKILSIETSTKVGSVAVVDFDESECERTKDKINIHEIDNRTNLMGEYTLNVDITHTERLLPQIDELLSNIRLTINNIDFIATSYGPGSFTALRIGLSTVKALAMAMGKPIVGVSSLSTLAMNLFSSKHFICPFLDAKRKEVYTALIEFDNEDRLTKLIDDIVLAPDDILNEISLRREENKKKVVFLGDGVVVYLDLIKKIMGSHNIIIAPLNLSYPRASNVARLAIPMFLNGEVIEAEELLPFYIRSSEVQISLKNKENKIGEKRDRHSFKTF